MDLGYVALTPLAFNLLKPSVGMNLMNLEAVAGLVASMVCKLTVGGCCTTEGGLKRVLTENGLIGGWNSHNCRCKNIMHRWGWSPC